jgi:Ca2+-binding EF-hand superfamily protein
MGNGKSSPRMAFSAIADMLVITRPQMMELRNACLRLSKPNRDKTNPGPVITKRSFQKAMEEIGLPAEDVDVFDHLFTMWDVRGEEKLFLLSFISGISPLASTMDVAVKIQFAIEIFDVHQTGRLKIEDALAIFGGINATASYFGDSVITPQTIELVMEDIFNEKNEIYYMEHINEFATHPAIIQFSLSAGTMRYGGTTMTGA